MFLEKGAFTPEARRLKWVLEGLFVLYFFGEDVLDRVEGLDVLVVARSQSLLGLVVDLNGASFSFHKSLKHFLRYLFEQENRRRSS